MAHANPPSDGSAPDHDAGPPEADAALRLTRYELEIMDVVWRLQQATVHDVCEGLRRPLAYTTVMTTLSLLESKKGVLKRTKKGRSFVYSPRITRDQASRTILSNLKDVLFNDSVPSLVLNLLADQTLSAEDIAALRKALGELEAQE